MSTAVQLAESGVSVIVVDERPESGGQFFKQIAPSYSFTYNNSLDSQYRDGAVLIERMMRTDARVISDATVWGVFQQQAGSTKICVAAGTKSYIVCARQLVLATGAFESVPAFPGWTLSGVMTTGPPQGLLRAYRVAAGQRVLIAGNGPLNLRLACELINGGVDVVAVAESAARPFSRCRFAAIGALSSSPNLVARSNGRISCHNVVNAAGRWTANIASMIGVTLPVKTAPQQMIVTEPVDPVINNLMTLAKRHLTMKQVANGNIIIGGRWPAGHESESGRAVMLRESIEGNLWVAQRVLSEIGLLQMIRSWATIGVMIDGVPIPGELPGHRGFFNAVGANGYTMGPILGQITVELIRSGQRIADIGPFTVDRFH